MNPENSFKHDFQQNIIRRPRSTSYLLVAFLFFFSVRLYAGGTQTTAPDKTTFQTGRKWNAAFDLRSDAAMVYGPGNNLQERIQSWRDHGYHVQFMTGIAWGNYQDYFTGKFDGRSHMDEGQVDSSGSIVWHGKNVPYVVPTRSYLKYIESIIRRVIDSGITTIYLEEPEFWARSGYSDAFKAEWKKYYGSRWEPQYRSANATYLSSKLKFHLYYHALKEVFSYAKAYGLSKGKHIRCFVATHSLLNYSSWEIVSPEASLASIPEIDGYIAQVWSNTAEVPNYYDGVEKSRPFETAFLEYGAVESMTAPSRRVVYFLTDPVADGASTWTNYRRTYEETFTAELMYPEVNHFEVMPWPSRIFLGAYKLTNSSTMQHIPSWYATQILVMINSLNNIPRTRNHVDGTRGIGVLLGNSLMFQRFPTHDGYSDPQLSNFYGMVLPLVMRGIPVNLVNMENLGSPLALKHIRVLVMSYADMKPLSPAVHMHLAEWVRKGGTLVYYGRDDDPFQRVTEWWDTGKYHFASPSDQLFGLMNIRYTPGTERYQFGKGTVYIVRRDPKDLVMKRNGDTSYVHLIRHAYEDDARAGAFHTKDYFYLQRGPYDIASVMRESSDTASLVINGPLIDLFDPMLPVLKKKIVRPGEQAYLLDLRRVLDKEKPQVLCAASRIYDQSAGESEYAFVARGPKNTRNVMRILLPRPPATVKVTNVSGGRTDKSASKWDSTSHTLLLRCGNRPDGVRVRITW